LALWDRQRVNELDSLRARSIEELCAAVNRGEAPKFVHFWGHRPRRPGRIDQACLSQWWPGAFDADGKTFGSAEQYMMWRKAQLFHDERSASAILEARSAAHAKALGREVGNFDEAIWVAHRWEIVVAGSIAKFRADEGIGNYLRSTGQRVLAEASPLDSIWGIGLAADDPAAHDPARWPGLNLLGFALMEARSAI
jgi:ribA/ribD-fused uncharacterized protein